MQRLYQPNPFNPVDIEDDDDSEEEEEEDKNNSNQIEQATQPQQLQNQLQQPSPPLSPKHKILLIKKCEEPEEIVQVVNQYWRVTADEIGDDEVSESSVQSKKNSPVQEHFFTEQLDESFERDYGCAEHEQTQIEIKGNGNKEVVVVNTEVVVGNTIGNTELAAVRVEKKVKETIQKVKEKPKERKRDTRKKEQEEYKGLLSPNQKKYNQNDLPFITSKVLDSCLKLPKLYNPKNGRVMFQQQNINYSHTANNNSEDSLDDLPDVPQHDFHLLSELIVNSAKLNIEKSQQINPRVVKKPTNISLPQITEHLVDIADQNVKKIQWVNGKRCLPNPQYLVQYIARNRLTNRSQWVDASEIEEDGAVNKFESLTHRQFLRLMIEKGQDKQMPPTFRIKDGKFIQPRKIQQKRSEITQEQDIDHLNHRQIHKQPEVQKKKQQQPEESKKKQSNHKQPVMYRQTEKSQITQKKQIQQNQLDLLDCDSIKFIEPSARTIQRMSRKKREKHQEPQESQTTREKSAEKVVAPWVPRKQVRQPKNDEVAQIKKLKEEMLSGRRGRREIKYEDLDTETIKGQSKTKRVKRLIEDSSEFENNDFKQYGDENEDVIKRKLRPQKEEKLDADRMFDSFRMIQNLRFGKNIEIIGHILNSQNRLVLRVQDDEIYTCYVEELLYSHTVQLAIYLRNQIIKE